MTILPQTIRGQVAAAFLVCFVFMALMIAFNYGNIRRLSQSMRFFALAEDVNSNLLEMRRYEKNYFLYHHAFDFEENVTYTNQLDLILTREESDLVEIAGAENYRRFVEDVRSYADLMAQLHLQDCEGVECSEREMQIRRRGQNLMTLADQFVVTERTAIDRLLRQMIPLPFVSLLALVVLLAFIILFIGDKVIRPLARITRESEEIAKGALRPISAYGKEKNEIHHLVSAINRMMTELESRQEQLIQSRKIASIGTLTAGIAHEINNPVNNLSLIMESLLDQSEEMDDEERHQLYREALDQADRTSEIVKNLLEFSRANAPKIEDVDLVEVVDKTARLVANEMKLNKIRFEKVVETDIPVVSLDRGAMQQVLLNLFMNSIQAIEHDGSLRVVMGLSEDGSEIRIDVVDDGPGIDPEHIGEIFDPFFTTKKVGTGTGLGLSVSYNIVEKHGGRLEVSSEPGQGACFSIVLPAR